MTGTKMEIYCPAILTKTTIALMPSGMPYTGLSSLGRPRHSGKGELQNMDYLKVRCFHCKGEFELYNRNMNVKSEKIVIDE